MPDGPAGGTTILERVFGFRRDGVFLDLGSQRIAVVQAVATAAHGRIDHIAIAVPDIDAALAELARRGAELDRDVTPGGVGTIAEFWDGGIRYVYLRGPEGARIELCQRRQMPVAEAGHDHIGIPCTDVAAMQGFFESHGARLISAVDLDRPEGRIPVRFMHFADGMIELYGPPPMPRRGQGLWSRLLVPGWPRI